MDVPRLNFKTAIIAVILIPFLICCEQSKNVNALIKPVVSKNIDKRRPSNVQLSSTMNKVTLDKILIRISSANGHHSKIAEVNFDFYGKKLNSKTIEDQKNEIRNLILIHFANTEFTKMPAQNVTVNDPDLSSYLNQFLKDGQIEQSEYKLLKVY